MGSKNNQKVEEAVAQMKAGSTSRTTGPCAVEIPGPCGLVIFGASGDLTKRKIIPSLYRLQKNQYLPERFFILGASRTEMSTDHFREEMLSAVKDAFPKDFDQSSWNELVNKVYYSPIDYNVQETYAGSLREKLLHSRKSTRREEIESFIWPSPRPFMRMLF